MAIAFDSSSEASGTSTSLTYSHTTSGDDRLLIVGVSYNDNEDLSTTVTYNGVSMTKIAEATQGSFIYASLWYLEAPATGANDIVVTISASKTITSICGSYTGCAQTGIPDASATATQASAAVHDASVTTTVDNCWAIYFVKCNAAPTAGDNTTSRNAISNAIFVDSNAAVTPAGSRTLEVDTSAGRKSAGIIASIAPVDETSNVSTLNSSDFANVANIDDTAKDAVATINGVQV